MSKKITESELKKIISEETNFLLEKRSWSQEMRDRLDLYWNEDTRAGALFARAAQEHNKKTKQDRKSAINARIDAMSVDQLAAALLKSGQKYITFEHAKEEAEKIKNRRRRERHPLGHTASEQSPEKSNVQKQIEALWGSGASETIHDPESQQKAIKGIVLILAAAEIIWFGNLAIAGTNILARYAKDGILKVGKSLFRNRTGKELTEIEAQRLLTFGGLRNIEIPLPAGSRLRQGIEIERDSRNFSSHVNYTKALSRTHTMQRRGLEDLPGHLSNYTFRPMHPSEAPRKVYRGTGEFDAGMTDPSRFRLDLQRPGRSTRAGKKNMPEEFSGDGDDLFGYYGTPKFYSAANYLEQGVGVIHEITLAPTARVYTFLPGANLSGRAAAAEAEMFFGSGAGGKFAITRISKADMLALRKRGVDALYDPTSKELVIVGWPRKVIENIRVIKPREVKKIRRVLKKKEKKD